MSESNTRAEAIEVMARGLCRLRIQNNLRYDTKGRTSEWVKLAEGAGWLSFSNEAEAALTALEASGRAVVPVAHLEPFAKYYRSRMAVQMRGMDDCIHAVHRGTEHEAEISVSDCGRLAAILPPPARSE